MAKKKGATAKKLHFNYICRYFKKHVREIIRNSRSIY